MTKLFTVYLHHKVKNDLKMLQENKNLFAHKY